jgi:hypothetical protein
MRMQADRPQRRGRKSRIGRDLWPELQRLDREGLELKQLAAWLLAQRGIEVSESTMSRVMAKIRECAPCQPTPPPELEPATDDEELRTLRRYARREMLYGDEWRQRQSGANLLLKVIEIQRQRREDQPPTPQPTPLATATPELTLEQEAELVRQHLGKRALP